MLRYREAGRRKGMEGGLEEGEERKDEMRVGSMAARKIDSEKD